MIYLLVLLLIKTENPPSQSLHYYFVNNLINNKEPPEALWLLGVPMVRRTEVEPANNWFVKWRFK